MMTLAIRTMTASGHDPEVHRYTTPDMIVSLSVDTSVYVVSTGSRLAGAYRMAAAISNAHVRSIDRGLREASGAAHRGQ